MCPWLLRYPPVSTYGICLVAALVAAWIWARRRARPARLDPSRIDLLVPLILTFGLLGAWSFGRLTDTLTGASANSSVLVGAMLVSTAAGITYAILSRIPLGLLGDILAPPIALCIGIGRIGCFFAGCCFGKVCAQPTLLTGVIFPADSLAARAQGQGGATLPVYPVQLYESAACLLLALAIWRWRSNDARGITGQKFLAVGISYAAIRFCIEFWRGDNPPIFGLTFSQWTAIVMFLLAAATWMVRLHFQDRWHLRRPVQPT
jgi:phosphatidylglycerol---prolipoprotein diacylglyceryl transferase